MTSWSADEKRQACIQGPIGPGLLLPDTTVVQRPGWYQVITPSTKSSILNEVCISKLEPEDCTDTIEDTIQTYRTLGLPTKWAVGPWTQPEDFGDRLRARGFREWDVRGMVIESSVSLGPTQVEIVSVDESNLDLYLDTFARGWNLDASLLPVLQTQHLLGLRSAPRIAHFFLGLLDGVPVATTAVLLRKRYGYLVGAQVLETARNRGIYRALVQARLAFLRERGITLAVTHAREATSAPRLEHLGFETAFRSKCFVLD